MEIIRRFEPLFGDWYAESLVGVGSFGRVYKAYREEFGERYYSAIKYISIPADEYEVTSLRDDGMDDESITTYYTALAKDVAAETRLMSKLKGYSNIVSYEDSRVVPKANGFGYDVFIRMELLESLSERTRKVSLSQDDVISLGIDICTALEVCGEYGIIHRDIKPDNIFINSHGDYKLGDFGIARQLEKTATFMSKKGTYNYMAPEVYKGEKYGATCDIYSLGLVMYRLLNKNRLPFFPEYPLPITPADKEKALLDRLSGKPIGTPSTADQSIASIIRTACAFNPSDRFCTPKLMKDALIQFKYSLSNEASIVENTTIDNTSLHFDEPESIEDSSLEDDATSGVFGRHAISLSSNELSTDVSDNTQSVFESSANELCRSFDDISKIVSISADMHQEGNNVERPDAQIRNASIARGDTIQFGSYFQDLSKAPIDWVVLEKDRNKLLAVTKEAIDCKPYEDHYGRVGTTWQNCSLRTWLNSFFFENAFSASEKDCVLQTRVSIESKHELSHNGQKYTLDKVFLLSADEARKYFPGEGGLLCFPTELAAKHGARYSSVKGCCWWLRSTGADKYSAEYVHYDGTIDACGFNYTFIAVRPAIWIEAKE